MSVWIWWPALGVPALAAVVWPLVRRMDARAGEAGDEADGVLAVLNERDRVYAGLADLEYDRAMGKIGEAEYETMKADLRASLAAAADAEAAVRREIAGRLEREMARRLEAEGTLDAR